MRKVLISILGVLFVCFLGILLSAGIINRNFDSRPDFVPESFCSTSDADAPSISIYGGDFVIVKIGESYQDAGADFQDDCAIIESSTENNVKVDEIGIYEVIYFATDEAHNTTKATRIVNIVPEYRGTIYLTFDDGPGPYTASLLDVLKKYNIKATFFVTGAGEDDLIAREYNEGHAIGLHTSSHNYAYIYQNINNFFVDLYKIQDRVKNITGATSFLLRFPGGSSNTVSRRYDGGVRIMSKLVNEVAKRGFTYFDWNITSGDAGEATSTEQIYQNVINNLKEGGSSVVLQHDVKDFSVAAVESIIRYGLSQGYVFDKLDSSSFAAHHRINN